MIQMEFDIVKCMAAARVPVRVRAKRKVLDFLRAYLKRKYRKKLPDIDLMVLLALAEKSPCNYPGCSEQKTESQIANVLQKQSDSLKRVSVLYENAASYTPDIAAEIDTEEEIAADKYGVSLETARQILKDTKIAVRRQQAAVLSAIIGHLIAGSNLPAKVHALAIAFGLDQLNGFHSQSEIARELGVTRALISHYVLGWRDVLSGGVATFDNLKFRKHNETRQTYREKATSQTLTAKRNRHEHH